MDDLRIESGERGSAKMDVVAEAHTIDPSGPRENRLESIDSSEELDAIDDLIEHSGRHDNDLFNCSDTPRDFSESFESLNTPRRARDSLNESFDAEVPLKLQEGSWSPDSSSKTAEGSSRSHDPSSTKEPRARKPQGLTLKIDTGGSGGGNNMWDNNCNDELDSPVVASSNPSTTTSMSGLLAKSFSQPSRNKHQIGSDWSITIGCLRASSSMFECIGHLRTICLLLDDIDAHDRVRYCKFDFESAIKELRSSSNNKIATCDEISRQISRILTKYFDENPFNKLPTALVGDIMLRLDVKEQAILPATCREWEHVSHSDEVWSTLYYHRFLRGNPDSFVPDGDYRTHYRTRMVDPELGDKVEVAWRGKFRLEAMDVYQGLAWWCAEIVDKHTEQGKYKIRYPGWESRWDEWVPRSRLRWAVERNTLCQITAGSVVELWCCGANVPGAWLESKVKKVRGNRYCINRVLTSGAAFQSKPLWVDRDRLRLVHYPVDDEYSATSPRSRSSSLNEFFFGSPSTRRRSTSGVSRASTGGLSTGTEIEGEGDPGSNSVPTSPRGSQRRSFGSLLGTLLFGHAPPSPADTGLEQDT